MHEVRFTRCGACVEVHEVRGTCGGAHEMRCMHRGTHEVRFTRCGARVDVHEIVTCMYNGIYNIYRDCREW